MTNKEILEGNVLIAEFMGWKVVTGDKIKLPYKNHYFGINPITKRIYNSVNSEDYNECWTKVALYVKYNSSWDWLMPVVDKIESLKGDNAFKDNPYIVLKRDHVEIFWWRLYEGEFIFWDNYRGLDGTTYKHVNQENTKISALFRAIVEFLKWYNKNKSKSI